MAFRIGGDGNVEIRQTAQTCDQIGAVGIAVGMRFVARRALRRIAAQRHDVAYTFVPITTRDVEHLAARGTNAGEMRRAGERSFLFDTTDQLVRAIARRAVRAIGHRHEPRRERCEPLHGVPQGFLHRRIGWREELERHDRRPISLSHGLCTVAA